MTKFCKTHVVDRNIPELRARKRELEARDLSDKPGLQAELERVATRLDKLLRDKSPDLSEYADRFFEPLKQPERPCMSCWVREASVNENGPMLYCDQCAAAMLADEPPPDGTAIAEHSPVPVEELEVRPLDVPEDPPDSPILEAVIAEGDKRAQDQQRIDMLNTNDAGALHPSEPRLKPSDTYMLGWRDCEAYFRSLANGSTFEVQIIQSTEEQQ